MPNRTIAPLLREITSLQLPKPEIIHLDNGIPVYITRMGTQPVVRMELVFEAGRWYEEKKLISRATSRLIKEGTRTRSGADIAETVDFYGGSLAFPGSLDTSSVALFCLTKHFDKLLPLVDDLLTSPAFAEEEVAKFKRRSLQRFKMDTGKTDVIAYRKITEMMFGKEHPYGYNSHPSMFDNIQREDLVNHFLKNYRTGNLKIFLSGSPTDDVLETLNKTLGRNLPEGSSVPNKVLIDPNPQQILSIPKKNNLQSAIRIGCKTFDRKHEDYNGFYVLNTILGGYFGARLMTNLREDKGYTYGVYSNLEPMRYDGYFNVSTEVAKGAASDAVGEIYKEFERLREKPIGDEELLMVRNYLLGYLLTGLDGPFNVSEMVKMVAIDDLDINFFDNMVQTIKTITPNEIQALANKYLKRENMYEVVVG